MNIMHTLSIWMLEALKFFFAISGNWGFAVILLTVATKIALYPLTLQSTKQMDAMQKLQPKLATLQKKLKGQPDKIQKETMELYKSEGVNPLGGCLPMLLQIPVFLALFFALTSPEFKLILDSAGAKAQFLWITNLAKPDTTYILVFLVGISTYWSSLTMPGAAKQQKGMLYFMPAFIAFISVSFPAGVQLYWVVQNLLTVAQQMYILRK
ncbi:MAG: YidC/Oxa1 family membrane protein insertase [bacterium]